MFRELLLSAEGTPSATSPKHANGAGKTRSGKSSKHSATKATAKRKLAPKRAKPSRRAAASKRGRPLQYTDKTVVRMPKGWLKMLNAKSKALGVGQGAFLRSALCYAITGKKPTAALG